MRIAPALAVLSLVASLHAQELVVAPDGSPSDRFVLQSALEWAAMQAAQNPSVHRWDGAGYGAEVASTLVVNGDTLPGAPAADSVVVLDGTSEPRLQRVVLDVPPATGDARCRVTFERVESAAWAALGSYDTFLDDLVFTRR